MGGSLFHGLEIGKRSLFGQQAALSTTGHNIANANSKGYSRQRVDLQASRPIYYPGMNNDRSPLQMGTGVTASDITRIREDFLDLQYRGENKNLGYWQAKTDILTKMEEILNEPSESGLQKVMDQFWQGWQELSKNPENAAIRGTVRQRGVAVAETFQHLTQMMDQVDSDLTKIIQAKVYEINSIAVQIRDLNDQITRLVPHGHTPNDLYDKRDLLIDQLSRLVDVETRHGENGSMDVFINGQALVAGRTAQAIQADPATGTVTIGGGNLTLTSGELLGLMESKGVEKDGELVGTIPAIRKKLNDLATKFVDELNRVHSAGLNMDDIAARKSDPNAALDQLPFFVSRRDPQAAPADASDMMVNPLIMASLDKIAAATSVQQGDGSNAQNIASLKFARFDIGGQVSTFDDFYRFTIAQLGIDSQESQRMALNSEVLVGQVENRRQSVSGVSIDEEMTNMVRYQQAYNAAARFITTIDEALERVINGMGRVGL